MREEFDPRLLASVQLVPPTPFSSDGRVVLYETIRQHATEMLAAGIRVFLPAAGTGEFHSLTHDEIIGCVEATRQAVGDRALVIAPIGFSLADAIDLGKRSSEVGADALLLMSPIHPYLCDDGMRDYLQSLAAAVPLPLLVYKKAGVPSEKLLAQLASEGVIAGVKYSVYDPDALCRFIKVAPAELSISCGLAERWAPYFTLAGARGFTSGAANICPRLSLRFYELLDGRNYADALILLDSLRPLEEFRARAGDSFNIGAIKWAMRSRGHEYGPARPPQRALNASEQAEVTALVTVLLEAEQAIETAAEIPS
jgi:4-hydroxy-tetrahydrodipicolinate synthase